MTLLALDPGRVPAYCLFVDGKVQDAGLADPAYRMGELEEAGDPWRWLEAFSSFLYSFHTKGASIDALAIEYQMLAGRFTAASNVYGYVSVMQAERWCKDVRVPFLRYSPTTIKKIVTGDGGSHGMSTTKKKAAILKAVRPYLPKHVLDLPKKEGNHIWDAVAIALTAKHYKYQPFKSKP